MQALTVTSDLIPVKAEYPHMFRESPQRERHSFP